MKPAITIESTVVAATGQVSADLDGEAVILGLSNGVYYGLDPVGTFVWSAVKERVRVRDVRDAILKEYEVEADRCERDLLDLLEKMQSEGLIDVVEE